MPAIREKRAPVEAEPETSGPMVYYGPKRRSPEERAADPKPRKASGLPARGVTRKEQMRRMLAGKEWEFVREVCGPTLTHTATGLAVKNYVVLRDKADPTAPEVIASRGELGKYAEGLHLPARPTRKARVEAQFNAAFD